MRPDASSAIVTGSVYRLSRNPMYLGFLLVLAAWAMFLSSLAAALVLPGFVGYMNRFQIVPEEQVLLKKFGPAYAQYMSRVRRWL
jgi:protein-S-isoprenylcysteine O-methyltransferase Ste14